MSGKNRIVWAGVANIRLTLQAEPQRMALLPKRIGEGLAKLSSKRWQGLTGERRQCARSAYLGDQCHRGITGCRDSRAAVARLRGERRNIGMKSGDLPQQIGRLERVRTFAAEDGKRQDAHSLMRGDELTDQARMHIRGGELSISLSKRLPVQ
jgi:hypothetical protein